jgi:PAS domain S-box-containing protein
MATEVLTADQNLASRLDRVFGSPDDPMPLLERRALELLPDLEAIVWEGDAQTFQFTFVGRSAEDILGFPCERWLTDPTFWTGTVVHPQDRDDAIAYCALATGQGKDHDFEYRANTADGRVVWLHDVVRVVKNTRGVAERLRGVMIDVSSRKAAMDDRSTS